MINESRTVKDEAGNEYYVVFDVNDGEVDLRPMYNVYCYDEKKLVGTSQPFLDAAESQAKNHSAIFKHKAAVVTV